MIRCPSATRQRTASCSVSSGACTTRSEVRDDRADGSAAPAGAAFERLASKQPLRPRRGSRRRSRSFGAFAQPRARRPRRRSVTSFSVGVEADVARDTSLKTNRSAFFARASRARARARRSPASAAKPTSTCPLRAALAELGERRRSSARARPSSRSPSFGALARERVGGPVVGDGGRHQHDVRVGRARSASRSSSRRGRRLDDLDAGAVPARRGSQRAASRRAPRARASAASATPIRPDERLPRKRTASSGSRVPPAVTRTRLPASEPGRASSSSRARDDLLRLRHPPHADSPSAVSPSSGPTSSTPRARSSSRVRAASPDATTCAGSSPARRATRPAVGERRLGQDVVGEAVRELRERVRRAAARRPAGRRASGAGRSSAGRPAGERAEGLGA